VLSCWGAIASAVEPAVVTVAKVFGGAPPDGAVLVDWDRACGASDPREAWLARRAEDRAALEPTRARAPRPRIRRPVGRGWVGVWCRSRRPIIRAAESSKVETWWRAPFSSGESPAGAAWSSEHKGPRFARGGAAVMDPANASSRGGLTTEI
jgi:hypothetical protein